jgi:phosphoglycolate phosphatase
MSSSILNGARAPGETTGGIEFDRIRLVLFDLDGTLVDSLPDLAWCGNAMLGELGLAPRDPEAARAWVGNGIERFVKRFLTGAMQAEPEPELFARGLDAFIRIYAVNVAARSRVYDGVFDCLDALAARGLRLGCVTNKAGSFTADLLREMELDGYFELVVAGDTTPRKKPDPMPLRFAADHFGLDCAECLMVGDSANDVEAARAAGFRVVAVPYGYNHGYSIHDCSPDLVVADLRELAELFSKEGGAI